MFCAKCGAVLADDARKCDQCGAPVRIRPGHEAAVEKKAKKGGRTVSAPVKKNLSLEDAAETGAEAETLRDPVFYEEADRDVDVDAIIKIARGEEPDYGGKADTKESFSAPEDDEEPELDMDTYLAGMPLIQKIRRSISMRHHRREEAADQRRMNRQLERALHHFAEEEKDQQKAEELRAEAARLREAEKVRRREAERAEAARRQQEKVRAEKAAAERAEAARRQQEKARTEKAAAERAETVLLQEEKAGAVKAAEKSAEAVILQEEKADTVKTAEKSAEAAALQEKAGSGREAHAAEKAADQEVKPASEKAADQEVKPASEKAAESRNKTAAVTTRRLNYAELTPEERRIEKARRLRKFQENQPDSMDEFLGRYGMTKDAAVRIATLFLIALLSIIYVMGRGSGTSVTDAPVAGDSITGTTAAPGQEEGGMPAEESGEIQVPTGGGEFGNE
ncbi:MAG: hypothetical protein J6E41_02965 [Lachnospiraceae bacterium]|nr:hypothetical protein [Lachnospiraceae bacterium]